MQLRKLTGELQDWPMQVVKWSAVYSTAVLMLCAATVSGAQDSKTRIAVLTFSAIPELRQEAEAATEELRKELYNSGEYDVVPLSFARKILEEWESKKGGITEKERAVRIGRLLNVQAVITGKLSRNVSGDWQLSATLLDARNGVAIESGALRHPGDILTLLDFRVTELFAQLSGEDAPVDGEIAPWSLWREPITRMEFFAIPGGSYEQGCPSSDCDDDERPIRRITLSSFWLGKTEITQGQ